MFSTVADRSAELARSAHHMPIDANPLVVYSFAIRNATEFRDCVPIRMLSDSTKWQMQERKELTHQQTIAIVSAADPAERVMLAVVPHHSADAIAWKTLDMTEDQLSQRAPEFVLALEPGFALLTHGGMPWHLMESSHSVKILRVPFITFPCEEVLPTMSESSASSVPTSPAAAVAAADAAEEQEVATIAPPKTWSEATALYDSLIARIAALDPKAWNSAHAKKATDDYAVLSKQSARSSKEVTRFGKLLATLAKRVTEAETWQATKLPEMMNSIKDLRARLTKISNGGGLSAGISKRVLGNSVHLTELEKCTSNLVSKAKKLAERVEAIEKLEQDVVKKSERKASKPSKPKQSAAPAATKQQQQPPMAKVIDVPTIVAAELTPNVLVGQPAWSSPIKEVFSLQPVFLTIVTANPDNLALKAFWDKYLLCATTIQRAIRACEDKATFALDVAEITAYGRAMQEIQTAYTAKPSSSSSSSSSGLAVARAVSEKGTCVICEQGPMAIFAKGACRTCYAEDIATTQVGEIEDRMLHLNTAVKREIKDRRRQGLTTAGPEEMRYEVLQKMHVKLVERRDKLGNKGSTVAVTLKAFNEMLEKMDGMLPTAVKMVIDDEDEDGDGDSKSVVAADEGSAESSSEKVPEFEQQPLISGDEASASSSAESSEYVDTGSPEGKRKKHKKSKKTEGLAHDTLMIMHAYPVTSVRDTLLEQYAKGRHDSLACALRDLPRDNPEIWGVEVTDKRTGEVCLWPTYYLEKSKALENAMKSDVKDVFESKVVSKRIRLEEAHVAADGSDAHKKSKAENENASE